MSKSMECAIAGGAAGAAEYLFRQPFDVLKVRLQTGSAPVSYARGVVPSLLSAIARNSLLFSTYHWTRERTNSTCVSGAIAGVANGCVFQIADVVKIKQQTSRSDRSSWSLLNECARRGTLGRGLTLTMAREIVACPIYYKTYETWSERGGRDNVFEAGCLAGLLSSVLTHPIDVMKSNVQSRDTGRPREIVRDLVRSSARWWCRGAAPILVSVVPATGICFYTFECARAAMTTTT